MQFQFFKGRYCLSFAVLFHFGRAPVNGYAAHGHLINFDYLLATCLLTAVNAPQRRSFSDTNMALQVMAAFNARD